MIQNGVGVAVPGRSARPAQQRRCLPKRFGRLAAAVRGTPGVDPKLKRRDLAVRPEFAGGPERGDPGVAESPVDEWDATNHQRQPDGLGLSAFQRAHEDGVAPEELC